MDVVKNNFFVGWISLLNEPHLIEIKDMLMNVIRKLVLEGSSHWGPLYMDALGQEKVDPRIQMCVPQKVGLHLKIWM